VLGFLYVHLFEDGAAARVVFRQTLEVAFEVLADLSLRFCNEAEAPAISERATGSPDRECAGIPERTETARRRTEFVQALLAPGEVIELFVGGRCICSSIDVSLATAACPW